MSQELEEVGRDIERLIADPGAISAPFTRLFRGWFHRFRWRPSAKIEKVQALVTELERRRRTGEGVRELRGELDGAVGELRDNVAQVERATVVSERPQVAHAAWLRRLYELLVHAQRAIVEGERGPLAIAAAADEGQLLAPLSMGEARDGVAEEEAPADEVPRADPTRVLELQLDTIDHLMGAAREENALLGRRRRLLDAARQLLLESSAALTLEREGVQRRLENIARHITRINRYQAVGLQPDVALLHQARSALANGDRDRVFAALSVIRQSAAATGDLAMTKLAGSALEELTAGSERDGSSISRSATEVFGERVVEAIRLGYEAGRTVQMPSEGSVHDHWLQKAVREYYAPGQDRAALAHTLTVDGCFDVGGVLSPVRVMEEYIRHRLVPYPTQRQALVQAAGPQDIRDAVIRDPRLVVLDLAAGRLLARRFVEEEVALRRRTVMKGEVRVYVLDGSTSMLGPRARMRDSILVAELATLMRRLEDPRRETRVVLFYRYFNSKPGPVSRVDTPGGAVEGIRDVTGTPRSGGTDIEAALLSSMGLIRSAQQADPELARAQIVLVTDGEAPVSEGRVNDARALLGDLTVNVSVIALGAENPALRQLVARQRAHSERAFYHHLPDHYLERVEAGKIDHVGIHLPAVPRSAAQEQALDETLGALLEDLVDLQRDREAASLRELDRTDRDNRIERAAVDAATEGERARLEALYRDDRGLQRRYDRWFPRPPPRDESGTAMVLALPGEGTIERDDIDSMLVLLTSISEVVETVGGTRLGRQADAVDMLSRLLPNARLSPARYHELLRTFPQELGPALERLHGTVEAGLGWQIEHKHGPGRR